MTPVRGLIAWACVALVGLAAAQTGPRLAEVELGFRGESVADAWNPLRLTLRDVGRGRLTLVIDQGSLREGEIPWTVVVPIEGGAGVRVWQGDVYLPAWRSLRWSVDAGGAVVASGALPREAADRRRVDLVVSDRAGAVAERLAGRVVDVDASALPSRTAAYDGVRSVWVDGSAGVPSPAALTAAAAAGAVVVVADAWRPAAGHGLALPHAGWFEVAAGGWWALPDVAGPAGAAFAGAPSAGELEAARVDLTALTSAFAAAGGLPPPATPPVTTIVAVAAVYVVLVVVAWRVGGAPGLLTWLVLLAGATAAAWGAARPPAAVLTEVRALQVGAGELAWRVEVHDLFTLPAGAVAVARSARPVGAIVGTQTLGPSPGTVLQLPRWRGTTLAEAPRAAPAVLTWGEDGLPRVIGDAALSDVRWVGGPAWPTLAPGEAPGAGGDPTPLTLSEAAFEGLLPAGSVWARADASWHVALPPGVRW